MAEAAVAEVLVQVAVAVAVNVAATALAPKPPNTQGAKLGDKRVQTSTYGETIPKIFGTVRIAGSVIWATDLVEVSTTTGGGGGKGAPNTGTSTQYTYNGNFAIMLCEGQITGIRRVWADGRLIYSSAFSTLDLPFCRVYTGDNTQLPDPFIESVEGIGNTPAYRGRAYVVFENYSLAEFGNRVPQFNFEVERSPAPSAGGLGSSTNPFLFGSNAVQTLSSPVWGVAGISASNGAALWQNDYNTNTIVTVERNNAGTYGFQTAVHTASPSPAWSIGAFFPYDLYGGINSASFIWGGSSYGRRIIHEQAGSIRSVFIGSAATTAQHIVVESFQLNAAHIGGINNYSKAVATANQRLKCLVDYASNTVMLVSASLFGQVGGIIKNDPTNGYSVNAYNYASLHAQGWALLDACFDGTFYYTVERKPNNDCVLKKFSTSFNLLNTQDLPLPSIAGSDNDWAVYRNGFTYCLGRNTNALWVEFSGRWCLLGYINSADAAAVQHSGFGRDLTYSYVRPSAGGWVLTRYSLTLDPVMATTSGLGGTYGLDDIITELCATAGVAPAQLDVSGITNQVRGYMVARQMTARAAIESVAAPHFVAAVESDLKIKFAWFAQPVIAVIPDSDLAARLDREQPKPLMQITRRQEVECPSRISVVYASFNGPNYDYAEAETHADRLLTSSDQNTRQDVPVSLKQVEATAIADAALQRAWQNRTLVAFSLPLKYSFIEPLDVIQVRGYTVRIQDKSESKGVIGFSAVVDDPSVYPYISANDTFIQLTGAPNEATETPPPPPPPPPDPN